MLVVNIESDHPVLDASTLSTLRTLEDKIRFRTLGGLKTTIRIVNALSEYNDRLYRGSDVDERVFNDSRDSLCVFLETLKGHVQSVEVMEKRIDATISSVSFASMMFFRAELGSSCYSGHHSSNSGIKQSNFVTRRLRKKLTDSCCSSA